MVDASTEYSVSISESEISNIQRKLRGGEIRQAEHLEIDWQSSNLNWVFDYTATHLPDLTKFPQVFHATVVPSIAGISKDGLKGFPEYTSYKDDNPPRAIYGGGSPIEAALHAIRHSNFDTYRMRNIPVNEIPITNSDRRPAILRMDIYDAHKNAVPMRVHDEGERFDFIAKEAALRLKAVLSGRLNDLSGIMVSEYFPAKYLYLLVPTKTEVLEVNLEDHAKLEKLLSMYF